MDWAPAEGEGDEMLLIFDGGILTQADQDRIAFGDGELAEWVLVSSDDLDQYSPARLVRRLQTAIEAKKRGHTVYAEHGDKPA